MSLGVEHEDGVIDDRLDQLLVSASIEPAGFVACRHRLSLKRVLAGHTASSPKSAPSIGPQTLMREPWLGTIATCSRSSHAKLMREPWVEGDFTESRRFYGKPYQRKLGLPFS